MLDVIKKSAILLSALFLLNGCNAADNNSSDEETVVQDTVNDNLITHYAVEDTIENRILFEYPQFDESVDDAEKYNLLITDFVGCALDNIGHDDFNGELNVNHDGWDYEEITGLSAEIKYEITRNDSEYLSVVFDGIPYYKGAAHPYHYFNVLILDVKNCKLLSLSDLYVIDDGFIDIMRDNYKKQMVAYLNDLNCTAKEYSELYKDNAYYKDVLSRTNKNTNGGYECFLTENELGISFPIAHALGEHFEVYIDFDKLINFKK